jgi:hypothetical protein
MVAITGRPNELEPKPAQKEVNGLGEFQRVCGEVIARAFADFAQ